MEVQSKVTLSMSKRQSENPDGGQTRGNLFCERKTFGVKGAETLPRVSRRENPWTLPTSHLRYID